MNCHEMTLFFYVDFFYNAFAFCMCCFVIGVDLLVITICIILCKFSGLPFLLICDLLLLRTRNHFRWWLAVKISNPKLVMCAFLFYGDSYKILFFIWDLSQEFLVLFHLLSNIFNDMITITLSFFSSKLSYNGKL